MVPAVNDFEQIRWSYNVVLIVLFILKRSLENLYAQIRPELEMLVAQEADRKVVHRSVRCDFVPLQLPDGCGSAAASPQRSPIPDRHMRPI